MEIAGYIFIAFSLALIIALLRELRLTVREFRITREEIHASGKGCGCGCDTCTCNKKIKK